MTRFHFLPFLLLLQCCNCCSVNSNPHPAEIFNNRATFQGNFRKPAFAKRSGNHDVPVVRRGNDDGVSEDNACSQEKNDILNRASMGIGRIPPIDHDDDPIRISSSISRHYIMLVLFGRPGSGKTTIANAVIESLMNNQTVEEERKGSVGTLPLNSTTMSAHFLGLDLDVCVPQWMKDNFAKGIYPTLQQRIQFAHEACDYVSQQVQMHYAVEDKNLDSKEVTCLLGKNQVLPPLVLVSFSFVNSDLRQIFSDSFPDAIWVLVDTTEEESQVRIWNRKGHFYKGQPQDANDRVESKNDNENADWKFAPVTFPHLRLDGMAPVAENAERVVQEYNRHVENHLQGQQKQQQRE